MDENGQIPPTQGSQPPAPTSTPPKAKTRPLTPKQRLYIKIRASQPELSEVECKRRAGYTETSALKGASVIKNRNVQDAVRASLEEAGLTPEYLAQRVKEGTQAYRASYINRPEEIVEKKDIDFNARQKAVELSYRLRGEIIDRREEEHRFPNGIPVITDPSELKTLERQYGHIFSNKKRNMKK